MQISKLYKHPDSSNLDSAISSHGSSSKLLPSARKIKMTDVQEAEGCKKMAEAFQGPVNLGLGM